MLLTACCQGYLTNQVLGQFSGWSPSVLGLVPRVALFLQRDLRHRHDAEACQHMLPTQMHHEVQDPLQPRRRIHCPTLVAAGGKTVLPSKKQEWEIPDENDWTHNLVTRTHDIGIPHRKTDMCCSQRRLRTLRRVRNDDRVEKHKAGTILRIFEAKQPTSTSERLLRGTAIRALSPRVRTYRLARSQEGSCQNT